VSGVQVQDAPRVRRIREEVRDGVYVMVFSCVASTATAGTLVLLTRWVG